MKQVQLIGLTPEQLQSSILEGIKSQLEELKKNFEPKTPDEYLARAEVARMLKVDISTVHNWTVSKILTSYGIGRRVYYKRAEVENAIIQLEK
tara:strand:- start:360641 stop:360919 length:279 start_codon:yes stop_codon:yes gene_type:complete